MVRISALGTVVVSEGSKHRAYIPLLDDEGKLDASVIPTEVVVNQVGTVDAGDITVASNTTLLDALNDLTTDKLSKASNLADVTSVGSSRINLGLGSMATQDSHAVNIWGGTIDGVVIGANTPANAYFNNVNAQGILISSNIIRGNGDPNGVVEGTKGSVYQRTDVGAPQTLYVKEDDSLNTGWQPIVTSGLNFDPSLYSMIGHKHSPNDVIFPMYNDVLNVPLTAVITDIRDIATSKLGTANNLSDLGDAPSARLHLGLGTMAIQDKANVDIEGGAIDGTAIGQYHPSSAIFTSLLVQLDVTARNVRRGNGSPINLITGNRGDIYQRTDGGPGSSLYIKEGGNANSTAGWTPIGDSTEVSVQQVLDRLAISEVPDGIIDGVNIYFITAAHFELGTTCVYLNGLRLRPLMDYTENDDQTIQFFSPPLIDDTIVVDYVKSSNN